MAIYPKSGKEYVGQSLNDAWADVLKEKGLTSVVKMTYENLKSLHDAGKLQEGSLYEIADFQTLHIIPNTTERNDTNLTIPVEPLIVFAVSNKQLAPQAWSTVYPEDVIQYDITGDYWGAQKAEGSKGCITYRKSGKFEMNWDFRHLVTRTWCYEMETSWYSSFGFTTNFTTNGIERGWNNTAPTLTIGVLDGTNVNKNLTLTPESTELYNADTNPYGYKDRFIFDDDPSTSRFGNASSVFGIFGSLFTRTFPVMYCRNYNDETTSTQIFRFDVRDVFAFNNIILKSSECFLNINGVDFSNNRLLALVPTSNIVVLDAKDAPCSDQIITTKFEGCRITWRGDNRVNSILNVGRVYGQGDITLDRCQRSVLKLPDNPGNGTRYQLKYAYGVNVDLPVRNFIYDSLFGFFGISQEQTIAGSYFYNSVSGSDIVRSRDAVSAINLNTADLAIAGILDLTGSGIVNISTLQRWNNGTYIFHPIVLRPASGLTISIAQNNVANGFIQSSIVTANGTNGEVIKLELVDDRWIASN